MNARLRLAELDATFNTRGSSMHLSTYSAQREQLRREIAQEDAIAKAAPPVPAPAAAPKNTVTWKGLMGLIEPVMKEIGKRFREDVDPLAAKIADLERRLAQVESGGIRYEGVWAEGKLYSRGMFVTRSGSLWHANRETYSKPGESSDWTLSVKSGRDGRDAR